MTNERFQDIHKFLNKDLGGNQSETPEHLEVVAELNERFNTVQELADRAEELLAEWKGLHKEKKGTDPGNPDFNDRLDSYVQRVVELEAALLQLEVEAQLEEEVWWQSSVDGEEITDLLKRKDSFADIMIQINITDLEELASAAWNLLQKQKNEDLTEEEKIQYGLLKRKALKKKEEIRELIKITQPDTAAGSVVDEKAATENPLGSELQKAHQERDGAESKVRELESELAGLQEVLVLKLTMLDDIHRQVNEEESVARIERAVRESSELFNKAQDDLNAFGLGQEVFQRLESFLLTKKEEITDGLLYDVEGGIVQQQINIVHQKAVIENQEAHIKRVAESLIAEQTNLSAEKGKPPADQDKDLITRLEESVSDITKNHNSANDILKEQKAALQAEEIKLKAYQDKLVVLNEALSKLEEKLEQLQKNRTDAQSIDGAAKFVAKERAEQRLNENKNKLAAARQLKEAEEILFKECQDLQIKISSTFKALTVARKGLKAAECEVEKVAASLEAAAQKQAVKVPAEAEIQEVAKKRDHETLQNELFAQLYEVQALYNRLLDEHAAGIQKDNALYQQLIGARIGLKKANEAKAELLNPDLSGVLKELARRKLEAELLFVQKSVIDIENERATTAAVKTPETASALAESSPELSRTQRFEDSVKKYQMLIATYKEYSDEYHSAADYLQKKLSEAQSKKDKELAEWIPGLLVHYGIEINGDKDSKVKALNEHIQRIIKPLENEASLGRLTVEVIEEIVGVFGKNLKVLNVLVGPWRQAREAYERAVANRN